MQNPLSRFVPQLVGEYPKQFMELYEQVNNVSDDDSDNIKRLLWEAYDFGITHHEGQKRKSGEPYFNHCVEVAKILAEWKMDHNTIIGGLLHDSVEDTGASLADIREKFGEDITNLVDGVTKLGGIKFSSRAEEQAGNFMKMLLSVAKDIRVIIIKFADRLHNMQTIEHLSRMKQHRIAVETRDVFVPLAHRLGMANVKSNLEDLVFKTLKPKEYKDLDSKIKSSRKDREKYIKLLSDPLQTELNKLNLTANIYGRVKSHASIFGKMIKRNKTFKEIYDHLAIRIIVEKIEDCYLALGIIHNQFTPVQERFKDFIASPKSNAYQSIHTTIVGPGGKLMEIQIRTHDMEAIAEIGVAAHWQYKEGGAKLKDVDSNIKWLRELVEILQSESSDPREFMNLLKIDLFSDEIFVFTPNGDLKQLPINSTPIDFAFHVHTEVGLHCLGAKINHSIVPLNTKLKNGDSIEIITSKTQKPSYGWLNFVVTTKARTYIKKALVNQQFEESVELGKEILLKTLRRMKMKNKYDEIEQSYQKFGFNKIEQLLEAIGKGDLMIRDILQKINPEQEDALDQDTPEAETSFFNFARSKTKGIKLQGISNLMVSFGKCCNPIPGDEMIGFVTRGRGITVHKTDCSSLPLLNKESDRLIPVEWDVDKKDLFNVRLKVVGEDRKGLLNNLTDCINKFDINIVSVDSKVKDTLAIIYFIIQINNVRQLERIFRKMTKISGVDFIERTGQSI
ncbi:MAG TPA: bifunctional (p)ppGpp synthetase/guanosine-3',5'-bis(diphosphate) 3'-pyrophosphohydrolase [Candidatus Marinimicrobia bacterium]|nr:bifunctional (p)ppGpp synthetase/guanosine-3',5'-bis(diphosphate) 3'-pyrophosphohydrolase [Candidatus Neomarinimicrobiota bacterium]